MRVKKVYHQAKAVFDMIIIPAIDLKGGKCVRLRQGKADEVTVYSEDPVEMARFWEDQGAEYLHVVDLDGAFEGRPIHQEVIKRIAKEVKMPVEVGGGLRTDADISSTLDMGVDRVIIGTRAFNEPDALAELCSRFGRQLALGIDAREGLVQIRGWVETTNRSAIDLAVSADKMGISTIIYTDTATDGMMKGTNVAAMDELCASVECQVIASGGITTENDVINLLNLGRSNLAGAIVGKALYEGKVDLSMLKGMMNR